MILAALFLHLALAAADDDEPANQVKFEKTGYEECLGDMAGHAGPEGAIKVCRAGNGTYVDAKAVLQTLRGTDWFPASKYSSLISEVRITCASSDGSLKRRIVYPTSAEQGKRARVEIPCNQSAAAVKKSMKTAATLLRLSLKSRDEFSLLASREAGCRKGAVNEFCARYQKLVKDLVSGMSAGELNGRPVRFSLKGFEFRAGLSAQAKKGNDDLSSADPLVRLRAILKSRDEMDDRQWRDQVSDTMGKLSSEAQARLIEESIDDPDAHVRDWAMDNVSLLKEPAALALSARALDDPDPEIRSKGVPYLLKLGEAQVVKALHDPERYIRMQAYDFVIGELMQKNQNDRAIRYLELATSDQDESIRDFALGKLDFLKTEEENIRSGAPGWEDGRGITEHTPADR